ncbi:MAG TPA: RAMP superfamily CRISPR-associated protein [Methylococcales bacterium]
MARKIHSRIQISGTLVTETPLHVGGISNNPEVDLALAVNGQGQYYIPGTSLAGALRSWMIAESDEQSVKALWGFQDNKGKEEGHASFVIVEDAAIKDMVQIEIRDGVGIDRLWGSAAEHAKYNRAILPKGTQIPLHLTLEQEKADDSWSSTCSLWGNLIKAMEGGKLRLGASKTRGLGKIILKGVKVREQQLHTRQGMLDVIKNGGSEFTQEKINELLPSNLGSKRPQLTFKIHWEPLEPLMVKAEQDGLAVDMLPLVSAVEEGHVSFVLPGSSIKGVLRTQAERIVRTVLGRAVPNDTDSKQRFLKQIQLPLVDLLFGAAAKTENKEQTGGIGALSVDDCYAEKMTTAAWNAVLTANDAKTLQEALNRPDLKNSQQAFHVAIDRWTGGAADGMLYSVLEPMGITWEPIRLTVDLPRIQERKPAKCRQLEGIALLFLVLRDLATEKIPLGYGTNRGMGAVRITKVHIQGQGLTEELSALAEIDLTAGLLTALDETVRKTLNQAWSEWIKSEQPSTAGAA